MATLRSLLVLGRVSNLPTVWSNCLAGWVLGGGGDWARFAQMCAGGTLLYLGGMFLNDAWDAAFDREHRRERPIPSGQISERAVWACGFALLALGLACLLPLGFLASELALMLSLNILIYDAIHKRTMLSPLLMAGCRILLVLLAASAGSEGVTGLAVWSAVVLGAYIVGLSYVAKFESAPGALRYWPCLLLAAPLVLAWAANEGPWRVKALCLAAVLAAWTLRSLRFTFTAGRKQIGRTVSGLLAGIVLVDLLALAGEPMPLALAFPVLFILALLAQRHVPAT
jgi:heme O synthase-like polyprenyltransferase